MVMGGVTLAEFGERLKKARKAAGLSQVELAKITGLSKSAICNYESGKRTNPSIPVAKALAAALNTSWWELLGWKDFGGGVHAHEAPQETAEKVLANFRKHHPEWRNNGSNTDAVPNASNSEKQTISSPIGVSSAFSQKGMAYQPERLEKGQIRAVFKTASANDSEPQYLRIVIKDPLSKIRQSLEKLNEEGQEVAVERVQELTEIPRYKKN